MEKHQIGEMRNGLFMKGWKTYHPKHPLRKRYTHKSLFAFGEAILEQNNMRSLDAIQLDLYAYYLGETMVRTMKGAKWEDEHKSMRETCVLIHGKGGAVQVNPYHQILKFIHVKPVYFSETLNALTYIAEMGNAQSRLKGGEWHEVPGGGRVRGIMVNE